MKINELKRIIHEEVSGVLKERGVIGNLYHDITIKVSVDLSRHADERRYRHGDEITEEEIIATAEEAIDDITERLINDTMDVGDEFVIRDKTYDLNLVGVLERTRDPSVLELTVITVMRKRNFRPKSGTKVIDII